MKGLLGYEGKLKPPAYPDGSKLYVRLETWSWWRGKYTKVILADNPLNVSAVYNLPVHLMGKVIIRSLDVEE